MNVLDSNVNSRVALVKATKGAEKLAIVPDGTALKGSYVHYEDTNSTGDTVELIAVEADNGKWYASNSPTFRREFLSYVTDEELMNSNEEFTLVKSSGKTKAGRDYISCTII